MKCPQCGLINPGTAERCDCGYSFRKGTATRPFRGKSNQNYAVLIVSLLLLLSMILRRGFLEKEKAPPRPHIPAPRSTMVNQKERGQELHETIPRPEDSFDPSTVQWLSKRVVEKIANFKLRIGSQDVEGSGKTIEVYRVEEVNGDWLWLKAEGKGLGGWAKTNEVVPVERAIEYFTNHIRSCPSEPHGYMMRAALRCKETKDFDLALSDCNQAIRLAPRDPSVYSNRGTVWQNKREYDKAIADYDEAIRIDPKHALAYINRGNVWVAKREYNKAIADCNEAIRIDPKDPIYYRNRGVVWYAMNEYDKAVADYNRALWLDPHDAVTYTLRQ